jgi:drug/metabolite transporter (DMT)-like permease
MHWLSLTLLCAFSLAASDAVAKKYLSHLDTRSLTFIRLSFAGLLMAPLLVDVNITGLPAEFWLWMALTVPAELVAMYLYMKAIREYPLSLTVPYLAFTPIFVVVTGWLFLGESTSVTGFIGILLIVAGAWLLNIPEVGLGPRLRGDDGKRRRNNWVRYLEPFKNIFRNPGSRYMLGAAVIYSITASGSKAAMEYMGSQQCGALYFATIGMVALILFGQRGITTIKNNFLPALAVAALMAVMVFVHFKAIELVEAAYMISVKRSSLLFGIIFGVLFFQEKHLGMHLFAAGMMLAGVFVIAM